MQDFTDNLVTAEFFIDSWSILFLICLVFSALKLVDACLLMFVLVRVNGSGTPFPLDQFS